MHFGIAVFGVAAYLTAEGAENGNDSLGYLLHTYLGLSLAAFVALRFLRGLVGSGPLRFSGWSPFSRRQWALARQDILSLLQFRVPERGMHQGLAGLTQAFGLAIFAWMAVTGTGLFLLGSGPESQLYELIEETHEVGEALIPLYLVVHVGSVVLHSLAGNPIWHRMWALRRNARLDEADDLT
ncbi:MAG: cytochrome b/b6 domain-containing protein [Gammaproteobacteria bacterium]|nr:cytochrome b/b6 domain-containing protein [Gammaproteobacteria bacterium]